MSRIIAGAAGGQTLVSVPGTGTRPTTDRVKEALFSRLEAMGVLKESKVLDLYAGSGALGLESASRGAAKVDLVELDARAAAVCQRNADLVNSVTAAGTVRVNRAKVEQFLQRAKGPWDLVFLDPPYPLTEDELAEVLLALGSALSEGAVVVVERATRSPEPLWPATMELFSERSYGETRLWFAEPSEQDHLVSD
ncbi:methyltransferase [Renibacterium salmoninarum ATCC 33209]|uniref:Methyltransferase n=1 Tax=Renibacterium salmoninarum (strain ATCC 33209 / DSM 20767 / JCM 11484 / NBRC 15589 / NCIMB 2235) TaxID=288705 RepID=A9WMZ6_RENSM|nr:16S rRNA (guanine(966)-N(2))-methyltransferase RsmD [Renibacterium salmoninarum]ABY23516.1 methyltransferase [Renibacterium salmoninarum ATCC 33209]